MQSRMIRKSLAKACQWNGTLLSRPSLPLAVADHESPLLTHVRETTSITADYCDHYMVQTTQLDVAERSDAEWYSDECLRSVCRFVRSRSKHLGEGKIVEFGRSRCSTPGYTCFFSTRESTVLKSQPRRTMRLALLSAIIVLSLSARSARSWQAKTKQISPVILGESPGRCFPKASLAKSLSWLFLSAL